jgi:hypothetical protein
MVQIKYAYTNEIYNLRQVQISCTISRLSKNLQSKI